MYWVDLYILRGGHIFVPTDLICRVEERRQGKEPLPHPLIPAESIYQYNDPFPSPLVYIFLITPPLPLPPDGDINLFKGHYLPNYDNHLN